MKLEEFCTLLRDKAATQPTVEAKLETAATFLCQIFAVKPDEVAFFAVEPDGSSLSFLWPARLKKSGSIPLSVANSLGGTDCPGKKGLYRQFLCIYSACFNFRAVPDQWHQRQAVAYPEDSECSHGRRRLDKRGCPGVAEGREPDRFRQGLYAE